MNTLTRHTRFLVGTAFAAVLLLLGAGAERVLGTSPVFDTVPKGAVPTCTAALDAALPYRIREPASMPSGFTAGRCEIAGSPGNSFARRTQSYVAADEGWISITSAPKGATVNLSHATSTRQIPVSNGNATLAIIPVGGREFVAAFWDDGNVAVVINAMLSQAVTSDVVTGVARSIRSR